MHLLPLILLYKKFDVEREQVYQKVVCTTTRKFMQSNNPPRNIAPAVAPVSSEQFNWIIQNLQNALAILKSGAEPTELQQQQFYNITSEIQCYNIEFNKSKFQQELRSVIRKKSVCFLWEKLLPVLVMDKEIVLCLNQNKWNIEWEYTLVHNVTPSPERFNINSVVYDSSIHISKVFPTIVTKMLKVPVHLEVKNNELDTKVTSQQFRILKSNIDFSGKCTLKSITPNEGVPNDTVTLEIECDALYSDFPRSSKILFGGVPIPAKFLQNKTCTCKVPNNPNLAHPVVSVTLAKCKGTKDFTYTNITTTTTMAIPYSFAPSTDEDAEMNNNTSLSSAMDCDEYLDFQCNPFEDNALFYVAVMGIDDYLHELLNLNTFPLDHANIKQNTVFHWCLACEQYECFALLYAKWHATTSQEPNMTNVYGLNCVEFAIACGAKLDMAEIKVRLDETNTPDAVIQALLSFLGKELETSNNIDRSKLQLDMDVSSLQNQMDTNYFDIKKQTMVNACIEMKTSMVKDALLISPHLKLRCVVETETGTAFSQEFEVRVKDATADFAVFASDVCFDLNDLYSKLWGSKPSDILYCMQFDAGTASMPSLAHGELLFKIQ